MLPLHLKMKSSSLGDSPNRPYDSCGAKFSMTLSFYDENGDRFFQNTAHVDVNHLYEPFLKHLAPGAHILEAGCGSGRDAKAFLENGYQVTAFDGSAKMVELASEHTGLPVRYLTFQEMDFSSEFDGLWANASLLHVPLEELPEVFGKCIAAMKIGGVWYAGFKEGVTHRMSADGRHFTNFTEVTFREFVANFPQLEILTIYRTEDARPERAGEYWLNILLRRIG